MRERVAGALSSLTLRGRCLVAGGATLLLVGAVLGERSMVQVAVFVLALPLLSVVAVARQRFRLSSRRRVHPVRVPRGENADVRLEITNTDRRAGGLWVLAERLPPELGDEPQFVVEGLPGGAGTVLRYRVHGGRRGRYVLGPLRLRLVDPFGLVARTLAGTDTVPLVVVPRVRPLGPGGPAGGHGGGGEGARRSIAVQGEDDVSTREYRHGDDLRKVHWRSTARTGELMVRLEERPWRAQATLLLDTRARAHLVAPRVTGAVPPPGRPGDDAPPADTLEWVVEAAASIGTALARRGATVRVVTDAGPLSPAGGRGQSPEDLLDQLAAVGPSRLPGLELGIEAACRAAGEGPVVCLLGAVGADDVVDLVRARSGPARDMALLVDLADWADTAHGRARRGLSAASRAELVRQQEETAALLRSAGWTVALVPAGCTVEQAWADLGRHAAAAAPGQAGMPA